MCQATLKYEWLPETDGTTQAAGGHAENSDTVRLGPKRVQLHASILHLKY